MKDRGFLITLEYSVIFKVVIRHLETFVLTAIINNWNEYRRTIWGA